MSPPSPARPVRCAVVPPVPVPYREPLFAGLAAHPRVELRVIYQSGGATGWDQPAGWFATPSGYDARILGARQLSRPGRTPVVWPRGLERELSAFDPAVVVVSEFGPAALRALAWCRRRRRALVVLTEVTGAVADALPAPQRRLQAWLARRAAGFVAVSSAARDRLVGLGVAPGAIAVSLQGADLDPIRAAVAPARPGGGPVRVATVGRLVADKNLGRLLEAFARAELAPAEAELHVHGTGPLEGELRARAERLGVAVTFHGHTPPTGLPAAYAAADVFALASTFEPFGVAVREAVAARLPLVCSRAAGAAGDLAVDGVNALLVDPERVEEIAGALGRICREGALRGELAEGSAKVDAAHPLAADVAAFAGAILRAAAP